MKSTRVPGILALLYTARFIFSLSRFGVCVNRRTQFRAPAFEGTVRTSRPSGHRPTRNYFVTRKISETRDVETTVEVSFVRTKTTKTRRFVPHNYRDYYYCYCTHETIAVRPYLGYSYAILCTLPTIFCLSFLIWLGVYYGYVFHFGIVRNDRNNIFSQKTFNLSQVLSQKPLF